MTFNRLLKMLLNIKGATVDNFDFGTNAYNEASLTVHVHLTKGHQRRCPICGKKCPVYDQSGEESFWRSMDFGPVAVRIGAVVPRVSCPDHGVLTAGVPWAKHLSRFTLDVAYSAAWMVKGGLNKSRVSEYLRIDWDTVGRLVDLVWKDLEPDVKKRFDGLVRIGIDETSYKKGHSYITTVVNHDTNTVVWAHKGHGKEILELFFEELSEEQRASILVVTGDGARWITDCITKYCPKADRCVDPFHVVEWATDALDEVRLDAWRRARIALAELMKQQKSAKKSGEDTTETKSQIKEAKKEIEELKRSKYPLGKNPENLTEKQKERLIMIQSKDPKLKRAHDLKEELRLIFQLKDYDTAKDCLGSWIKSAQRCRIPAFVELQRKIRRHEKHILNTLQFGLSNARIEAMNNKIKLLIRIAYGFHNIDTMISLIMLFCSSIEIPWPGRTARKPANKGSNGSKRRKATHTHA